MKDLQDVFGIVRAYIENNEPSQVADTIINVLSYDALYDIATDIEDQMDNGADIQGMEGLINIDENSENEEEDEG